MLAKFRPRSAYDVMAALALLVALSTGGAYASHLVVDSSDVVNDSLTGADVRGKPGTSTTSAVNGSLTTDDIAGQQANAANGTPFIDGALTQWDIKNSAVTGADLAGNTVAAADIATNGVGAAEIAANAVGAEELADEAVDYFSFDWSFVSNTASIPPAGGVGEVAAQCPSGFAVISGGAEFAFPSGDLSQSSFGPSSLSWIAEGQNNGTVAQNLTVYALCIRF